MKKIKNFVEFINLNINESNESKPKAKSSNILITEASVNIEGIPLDEYGDKVGITDKSDSATVNKTEQPIDGPIGDISKSAYANINISTRSIPGTKRGNLGCAAAISIIFYRATGYYIIPNKKIEISTGALWDYLDSASDRFQKITNWRNDYKPGDIIITRSGKRPGHAGVVVEGGNIVSNSSRGFQGDDRGQVELNYNISSWASVSNRNPNKTACFRYIGPYRNQWGGEGTIKKDSNQLVTIKDSELEYGSIGPDVIEMQKALVSSGYNLPKYGIDGKFFAETRKALRQFQKDRGIAETGRLDSETRDQLFLKPEDSEIQRPADIIGKRIKIFDNEKRKIVIAKVKEDGTISITNRIGTELGFAKMIGDKITVEYDGKTMEATEQSENQVARSIYRIFNRIKGAIIKNISLTDSSTQDKNIKAFLDVIRYAEGTDSKDGYSYLFTSSPNNNLRFNDFSKHPNRVIRSGNISSTAAGAYQILYKTWNDINKVLKLPDFGPKSQDEAAIYLIKRRGALEDVKLGRFDDAIKKLNREWASLPGSPYGQPTKSLASLRNIYQKSIEGDQFA